MFYECRGALKEPCSRVCCETKKQNKKSDERKRIGLSCYKIYYLTPYQIDDGESLNRFHSLLLSPLRTATLTALLVVCEDDDDGDKL